MKFQSKSTKSAAQIISKNMDSVGERKQHLKICVFFCDDGIQNKEKRKFVSILYRVKNLLLQIKA